jgi:hypothetical protein
MNMDRQQPQPGPERIEISYSPWMILAVSLFFLWLLGTCLFWLRGLFSGHPVGIIVGLGALVGLPLVLLMFLPTLLHAWTHRGPVLLIDSTGVTDVRKKVRHVPWSDIARVRLGSGERAAFLAFDFKRPDRQRQDLPLLGPIGVLLNRIYDLGDWNVSLRMLTGSRHQTLQRAEAMRQRSIRQEVVALNRSRIAKDDPYQGWSGRL